MNIESERAAFEAWYETTYGISLEPEFRANHFIGYVNDKANHRWTAWQARAALSAPSHGEQVPGGWAFHAADFSCVASGRHDRGNVTLIRDQEGKAEWLKLTAGMEDVENAPPLYIFGQGRTLSEAIASAAAEAADAPSAGSQKE